MKNLLLGFVVGAWFSAITLGVLYAQDLDIESRLTPAQRDSVFQERQEQMIKQFQPWGQYGGPRTSQKPC